jgi:hypothetical protein
MIKKHTNSIEISDNDQKILRVAILAEEPLSWGSGKHYFPLILNGYTWKKDNKSYKFSAKYIFDKDILRGKLNIDNYEVLLVPGGGVGDGEAIAKGFNFLRKVRKWKKQICKFIEDGGGYIGICGGTALITGLNKGPNKTPTTFYERLYDKSSLGITCVTSYYKDLALPLLNLFQRKHPERVGATAYVFSFAPGETVDGTHIHSGGVPIDFQISKDNPIFSDFPKETLRIRWWGGPALIVPKNPDREVKVLANFPKKNLSEDKLTRIHAWIYTGGIWGLTKAFFKALKIVKEEGESLKNVIMYTYFLAGDWKKSNKIINLNYSNKPSITAEIYPNENKGRILLCAAHPEYMIWRGGHIEEVDDSDFNCIANGFHQWKNIKKLSEKTPDELSYTWWIVRRIVAWAAKVPDNHLPPIEKGKITEKDWEILSKRIFWDGRLISQIREI